jgi:hypothetical protein
MNERARIWMTGLQTLVLIQRKQNLGLVLVQRQRLVPGQRRLDQRDVKLLIVKGRRQLLLGWRHQSRYWSRCCR